MNGYSICIFMSCVYFHIVLCSMRKRLKFIYLPVDWLDNSCIHHIYGLSLCASECILCACFYCLLSTWALINFSQNALQLNGKLFYAIHANAQCRTMVQADSHSRTIDCCHFTLEAYVYESIIIYIDWWDWLFFQYIDFLIGIDTQMSSYLFIFLFSFNKWIIDLHTIHVYFLNKQ